MALQAKDNYFDTGSAGKPPRFNKDNFSLWKTRMELFLSGSDPQIPYFLENGPHVPTQTVHPIPAAGGQPAVPERELVKPVTDWNDEDRRLVNIDTKARSLIAMSLPDDVFHSVCHLRSAKEIWDTLCVQYEGTAVLMESRKIFLVRQYESFIHQKDETLSQLHQRFNCLLIDLKTIGTTYSNSEVVTKFMEALPEHWEIYTSCLTMSKDIKTLTLSELYGILLNREQQKKLKKNLIRDSKESKSTSVALVSDSVPPVAATSSSVTITELESSDSDMSEDPEFNESLALLTRSFKKFAKKGNFHKKKHLSITDKPKSDSTDKATAICYNCQGKGHFANDCRYRKSQFAPSSAKSSSKNPKYQRLKEKYKKMKTQRKGKGLIAEDCDWDDVSSDDSSDEEDTQVALMAIIEEPTLALMAKIEEVPEEIPPQDPEASSSTTPEASTSATDSSSQVPIPLIPLESLTQLDLVTLDLYKALNGKTSAEKMNIDLRGQLKECQEKLKHLTIVEENYKDQVSVNKTLCIERELALAAKEKALAQLNAEKVTIKGWSDASEKVDEILASGRSDKSKRGLGFFRGYKKEETKSDSSMLKFGKFVSSIPLPNASENTPSSSSNTHPEGAPKSKKNTVKDNSKTETPSKTKGPKPKNKVLGGGPSVSGTKSLSQSPVPRLKIDLKQKTQEKKPIPPMSNAKGILGTGPAHLKFKNFLDHTKRFQYRKCYHCGLNDHIASKCPDATKAEKSAKVKKIPKTEKSVKGKKVVKTVPSVKTPASCTDTSVKADTDSTSPTDTSGSIVLWDKGIWYLDSGCSRHMTGSKSVLTNYREERGPAVTFSGNGRGQTRGYGTLTNGVTTFKRVAYVEGLMHNLLSISQLCDKNHKCKVKNRKKEVILNGVRHADIYIINMNTSTDNFCFVSRASTDMNWLWHKRLSHLNFKTLNQLCINNLVIGLPDFRYTKESLCSACEKGKQTRASFKSKQISSISSPLQLLHMDLFGPVNVQSIGGKKYTLVIVDEYSRYTWVFFLRAKSDAPEEIILFVRKMEKLNNLTVRSIRSDHGTEFKNSTLESFFEQKGISQNFSSVRTPQQNGVAERRNRTLIEAARSMLSEANLATQFWAEAVNTACYTQNRSLIVKRFRRTAYELFRNRKPSIKHLHIFGCVCYILNNRDNLGKFDSKSDDGIFLGYSSISKTYRVFNKRRQTIEETIHVKFDESGPTFPHPNDNTEINQWADSFFQVPEPPIADPSPQDLPDGFEEDPIPPSDITTPPLINATPITQITPPEPDQPTNSEDFSQTTVSEPPPTKRAKARAQKKKTQAAGKKYYITLPQLFNKPSPLSKHSSTADTSTSAPVTQEPEVVQLEPSENLVGNHPDTLQASGSLGAGSEGHQDDPFNDFILTDAEHQLNTAELRRQSAERNLLEARTALQQKEAEHSAQLQSLQQELVAAQAAAAAAEAAAASATAAAVAATPPPTAVTLTIPCLDNIHDKVSQVASSSTNLQASIDDLKATALPALSTNIINSTNSLTTFQTTVVQRLDAQEAALRAIQEQVQGLSSAVNALTSAPAPPPSFTTADREVLQSLITSSFIQRKVLSDMASLLQRSVTTAALMQAPAEGERQPRVHSATTEDGGNNDDDDDDDEDDDDDNDIFVEKVPDASAPIPGLAQPQGENPDASGMYPLPSSPSSSDNQPISTLLKSKPTPETITLDSSPEDSPPNNLQMVIYQPPKLPSPEPTPELTYHPEPEPNTQADPETHDVNFGSVTGDIIRLMENSPNEQTRAELAKMTFRITPLNQETISTHPTTRFNPEASSSRTPEIRATPETICLSSDDEFISDDFSTPASSPRSPPSNSPRSEGENYPDSSFAIDRDGRLDAVIERLESTRVKIPLRTSCDSEFAYLSQEELASDFVDEDAEISADPILAQKAVLKVFNKNAEIQTGEVNAELDWCRDRLHLRKHGAAISGIHLRRSRGKKGNPGKTWITVKRSGVKDVEHTLDKLDRYNLSEWNEIRSLLPKANKNYRAEVEEVIEGLIARIRRTTEIPDDLLQHSPLLSQQPVRRSAGTSTRRPTPCLPRMVVKPLDLSMLDLSFPPGIFLSEGQVIREPVHGICVSNNSILRFQRFSELHIAPYEHLLTVLFTAQQDKKNPDNKEIIRTVRAILDHRLAFSDTPVPVCVKTEYISEESDNQDQDQETNESVLQSTDPVH
ncbi:hypothetical protein OSB04_011727 [Centaurea solstitialis]|uniref:Uncharacterized protein n=1 Tax=Centaurea solstitialis TaxID=347529 RepID=A0AA38TA00_9ASTR|nr:hypothetical protein OSB04_011727 [Centaurea solstitialis]